MAYNKFITQDGVVALDLTGDTITAETLEKGITAHDKHGVLIIGTMESGEIAEYDGFVVIEDGVRLISFTIDGTSYQAEDGMTWGGWCDSDYNIDNYGINSDGSISPDGGHLGGWVAYSDSLVNSVDVIVPDRAYNIQPYSSGGSN